MTDSQQQTQPEPCNLASRHAYALARSDDLRFLQAWEQGLLPAVGATVRVRQIRRALVAPMQTRVTGP